MKNRIETLRSTFKNEFDGYLIMNQINMLYFTDFLGAAATLVPSDEESILYVRGVNYEDARVGAQNCQVELVKPKEELHERIAKDVGKLGLKKLAFDTMNVVPFKKLSKALKRAVKMEAKSEIAANLRQVKDAEEIRAIRKAAELTVKGMQVAHEVVGPRLKEIEVAARIESEMRSQGSYGVAFDTIVASGPRSAFPHGGCGERQLKKGDLVVVDIGAKYRNYCADMTRTFTVSEPSAKQKKIFSAVREAQNKAFLTMRDGMKAAESDTTAREVIKKAGYGKFFVHGLGHGIGLEVHEQPTLNSTSKDALKTGNTITDEPGIYLIDFGGVRIEDTVLVKQDASERLTDGLYTLKD